MGSEVRSGLRHRHEFSVQVVRIHMEKTVQRPLILEM